MFKRLEDKSGNKLAKITQISEAEDGWLIAKLEELNFSEEIGNLLVEYREIMETHTFSLLDKVMNSIESYGMRVRDDAGNVNCITNAWLADDGDLCFKLMNE